MGKRITGADKARAYTLRHFFGRDAGARISAAEAANGLLPTAYSASVHYSDTDSR